jgi:hypothetical protein
MIHCFSAFDHVAAEPWVHLFAGQATAFEKRLCSGQFALMPWVFVSFVYVVPHCQIDSLGFVSFFGALIFLGSLWLTAWVKLIPTGVSWVFGAVFWLAVLGWASTNR